MFKDRSNELKNELHLDPAGKEMVPEMLLFFKERVSRVFRVKRKEATR